MLDVSFVHALLAPYLSMMSAPWCRLLAGRFAKPHPLPREQPFMCHILLLSKTGRKSSSRVCWLQSTWLLISVEGRVAKLFTAAYSLPQNVLRCGQDFEEGWIVAEGQWYELGKLSLRGYTLKREKTLMLVNTMVRIANLRFAGSRSGPQQRELRSGGMEFLGDDEHHAILDHLSCIV